MILNNNNNKHIYYLKIYLSLNFPSIQRSKPLQQQKMKLNTFFYNPITLDVFFNADISMPRIITELPPVFLLAETNIDLMCKQSKRILLANRETSWSALIKSDGLN